MKRKQHEFEEINTLKKHIEDKFSKILMYENIADFAIKFMSSSERKFFEMIKLEEINSSGT